MPIQSVLSTSQKANIVMHHIRTFRTLVGNVNGSGPKILRHLMTPTATLVHVSTVCHVHISHNRLMMFFRVNPIAKGYLTAITKVKGFVRFHRV